MRAFIRDALRNDVHAETAIQSEYVKQAQRYHGARSFKFITDYYIERQKKQSFIDENIFAQGFEKEEYLKILAKTKGNLLIFKFFSGLGPNVDFFSVQELEALAKKFKEEQVNNLSNGDFGPGEERKDGTMANFFDSNMQKLDGGTINKKMTARRPTKKVDGTILSRQKNVSCIVSG